MADENVSDETNTDSDESNNDGGNADVVTPPGRDAGLDQAIKTRDAVKSELRTVKAELDAIKAKRSKEEEDQAQAKGEFSKVLQFRDQALKAKDDQIKTKEEQIGSLGKKVKMLERLEVERLTADRQSRFLDRVATKSGVSNRFRLEATMRQAKIVRPSLEIAPEDPSDDDVSAFVKILGELDNSLLAPRTSGVPDGIPGTPKTPLDMSNTTDREAKVAAIAAALNAQYGRGREKQ